MKSPFLQEMKDRGYLNQCTNLEKLDELSSNKSITAYIGLIVPLNLCMLEFVTNNDI